MVNDYSAVLTDVLFFCLSSVMKTCYYYTVSFSMGKGHNTFLGLTNTRIRCLKYLKNF